MAAEPATWMTPAQAAEHIQVTRRTLERWIKAKKLPAFKIGRVVRIDQVALDRWVMKCTRAAGPASEVKHGNNGARGNRGVDPATCCGHQCGTSPETKAASSAQTPEAKSNHNSQPGI